MATAKSKTVKVIKTVEVEEEVIVLELTRDEAVAIAALFYKKVGSYPRQRWGKGATGILEALLGERYRGGPVKIDELPDLSGGIIHFSEDVRGDNRDDG